MSKKNLSLLMDGFMGEAIPSDPVQEQTKEQTIEQTEAQAEQQAVRPLQQQARHRSRCRRMKAYRAL